MTTDASDMALGAVLSLEDHPICFASRTLNEHELNYSTTEKELLAIVWATKYFRPYIFGRKFIINSDHRPLQWLHNLKEPNAKLQRWKIRLNEYNFDIKYIPGKENHVADALSRVKIEECNAGEEISDEISSNLATMHSAEEDSQNFVRIVEKPLNVFKYQIKLLKGSANKIHTYKEFSKIITVITYRDLTEEAVKDIIKTYLLNNNTTIYMPNDEDFIRFQTIYNNLVWNKKNKIFRTMNVLETIKTYPEFKTIILNIHLTGLHQGIEKIVKAFKIKYYYPNYIKEISKIINDCELWNRCKADHVTHKIPLKITPPTYNVRDKFVVDFWQWDKQYYLTCIDLFSKFAAVEAVTSLNWIEAKRALLKIFSNMGPPKTLKIDQD